jgi:ketosteroid isomerase-like protein
MRYLAALMFITCVSCAAAQEAKLSNEECAVWTRERSFANTVETHDAKAFAEHVHPGAVFSAATADPQRGRDAIVKAWQPIIDGQKVSLRWRPQFVSIGSDPNVAISRGPFVISSKDANGVASYRIGDFVSVWVRKDAKAPWKVLFDGGGPPPTTVSEEEATKHLQSVPEMCPRKE